MNIVCSKTISLNEFVFFILECEIQFELRIHARGGITVEYTI